MNKEKYYFVSYMAANNKGYGFNYITVQCEILNLKECVEAIKKESNVTTVAILFFKEISKKEYELAL